MRTTIRLEDDVHRAAKTLARRSGRPLGEVISALIRRGLGQAGQEVVRVPAFEVPRGAKSIRGARSAELLAEEGLD